MINNIKVMNRISKNLHPKDWKYKSMYLCKHKESGEQQILVKGVNEIIFLRDVDINFSKFDWDNFLDYFEVIAKVKHFNIEVELE